MVPCATEALHACDGVTIALDCYRQPRRDAESGVIICPGFFQSKDTPTFRCLAATLAVEHDVVAMDFRGHGASGGRYTFSARESADLDAVLDWVAARYARIGILGFSLGGAIAINGVSHRPSDVQSLTLVSAPDAFDAIEMRWWTPEAMRTGWQGWEPGAGCRVGNLWLPKEQPRERIQHLAAIPKLFIHGTRDAIVGMAHSQRLHAAAQEPKRLEIIEGGSHAEALFRDDPPGFSILVNGWFSQTLCAS